MLYSRILIIAIEIIGYMRLMYIRLCRKLVQDRQGMRNSLHQLNHSRSLLIWVLHSGLTSLVLVILTHQRSGLCSQMWLEGSIEHRYANLLRHKELMELCFPGHSLQRTPL